MSKRAIAVSVAGAVAVGGIAAGGVAAATASTPLTVQSTSARYTAPTSGNDGALTVTAKVSDDSGVRGVKVLAWPKSSGLEPKKKEMTHAENATCKETGEERATCTYVLKVTPKDAARPAKGTWYVATLATAEDGDTAFDPKAASFSIPR
ncbi:DUF5707 domain-containing protein [Streptomyces axinellae]|uniref:Secreted protein n=1 Tax=Streptomyces axinellae TaxID=552788 RepID=A0ABP6D6H8_9ACTN